MANFEQPLIEHGSSQEEKSRLELLRETIQKAPQSIEEEFSRTANPWLSCLESVISVMEAYMVGSKIRTLLTAEEYERAENRMEELKTRVYELKQQYPDKETIVPEDIRKELIDQLDILREEQ